MTGFWSGDTYIGDDDNETVKGRGTASETILGAGGNDNLSGLAGNDAIEGGQGNDDVQGGDGNDTLYAGEGVGGFLTSGDGKDTLGGGDGDDWLYALAGDFGDQVDGGKGVDTVMLDYSAGFQGGPAPVRIELGGSFVVLVGEARGVSVRNVEALLVLTADGADYVSGGKYADDIRTGDGNDTLIGGGGDDRLDPGLGAFLVEGGGGTDTLVIDFTENKKAVALTLSDTIKLGPSKATGIEKLQLTGGAGDDRFTGGDLADLLFGGLGDDTLSGLGDRDFLTGADGDDCIDGGDGDDVLGGGEGRDTILGGAGNDEVNASGGYDSVDLAGDVIDGGDGDDRLTSGGGDDDVKGGAGNDTLQAYAGDDRLDGGGGNDSVGGEASTPGPFVADNDTITGGAGDDQVTGGGGGDRLDGGTGNDTVSVLLDDMSDTVLGGSGHDLLQVSFRFGAPSGAIETGFSSGAFRVEYLGETVVVASGFEDLRAVGSAGDDTLGGGKGDDTLSGGLGADRLDGGAGVDAADFRNRSGGLEIELRGSKDAVAKIAGVDEDRVRDCEDVLGTAGADVITGDGKANEIAAWFGSDTLKGGGGKDVFTFDGGVNSGDVDLILDFDVKDDQIRLNGAVFNQIGLGDLDENAFRAGTGPKDASDRIVYDQKSGNLFYDPDGTGAQAVALIATFDNGAKLTADDFTVG